MEQNFKYQLERYSGQSTRHTCPKCNKKRNFARYVDFDGNYVGDDIGRCNSEQSCGYHNPPNGNTLTNGDFVYIKPETTYLNGSDIEREMYKDNLFKFLCSKFNVDEVKSVFNKYIVRSTDKKWKNSTVFYQRDIEGRYRTGKIISYNGSDGKRIKEPFSRIYWMHNFVTKYKFELEQCLFGEHLLESFDSNKGDIYLVESEKTCLIASLQFKNDLFIATGGLSNLNRKKLKVLDGYRVEALPDKGGYNLWKEKLEPLGITVNTVMEDSLESNDGDDIADVILMQKL